MVGNKKDIRSEKEQERRNESNEKSEHRHLVNFDDAIACANEFSAYRVIECSAKTKEVKVLSLFNSMFSKLNSKAERIINYDVMVRYFFSFHC